MSDGLPAPRPGDVAAPPATAILLVDKPRGMGSTEVVRELRSAYRTQRVGHTGTLDPDASGLLVICVGEATKLVPFLTAEDKVYEATITLGRATDTDDATGQTVAEADYSHVTLAAIAEALQRAEGQHAQVPPRYSAIRVAGRRMHERVRAGEDVDALLTPRDVTLHRATLLDAALPHLHLRLHVGKGYYVRSLARDLGEALGTAAHLSALRRTQVGGFTVAEAESLDGCTESPGPGLAILEALRRVMPELHVSAAHAARIRMGQRIAAHELGPAPTETALAVLCEGALVAVAEVRNGRLEISRGF